MTLFEQWRLLPQRFAVHEFSATAVIADVHLGYTAARQRLGDAIPWRSVAEEMQPLIDAAQSVDIRALIVAGDLFERGFDASLCQQFLDVLARLDIALLGLIPGNHDRGLDQATYMPLFPDGYDLAGWRIVHGDQPRANTPTVMGHWHPAIRLKRRKVPCFLANCHQLILPAFSLDAAGVDVRADPRWRDWDCYAVDGNDVMKPRGEVPRTPGMV
jgi:metallophosphoesterase superfamily enzyme